MSDKSVRRALVTGASSGIGREFCRQLASQGYTITAVARRESRLQALMEELPGQGHRYLCADLAEEDGVAAVAKDIASTRCHLLVNNAGFSVFEPFWQSSADRQLAIQQVNCTAVVSLSHAFLTQSLPGDALINVASVVAYLPTPAQPMYSASKAFLASLSECLWEEHRHRDVYVMGLCPGVTTTEFISTASGGESDGQTLPKALLQSSEAVVLEALQALNKRARAIVVTGRVNRLMLWWPRLLSRHRLLRLLAYIGDPERAL